jgi:hypothetical protein
MAEGLPLVRVGQRLLERALRNTGGLCSDANAPAVKSR